MYAEKARMKEWRFIEQAVSSYIYFYTNPRRFSKDRSLLEKAVWYIIKLVSVIEAFKNDPNTNFKNAMDAVKQVEDNLKIDLSLLKKNLMDYWSAFKGNRKELAEYVASINSGLKIAVLKIFESVLESSETETTQP